MEIQKTKYIEHEIIYESCIIIQYQFPVLSTVSSQPVPRVTGHNPNFELGSQT